MSCHPRRCCSHRPEIGWQPAGAHQSLGTKVYSLTGWWVFAGSCYCLNSLLNQLLKTGSLVCSSIHIDKIYLNCRVAAFFLCEILFMKSYLWIFLTGKKKNIIYPNWALWKHWKMLVTKYKRRVLITSQKNSVKKEKENRGSSSK